jgi:hypothetical protein
VTGVVQLATALLAAALPCVYTTSDAGTRASLETAGVERICADSDLTGRDALSVPGTVARAGVASPTRAPWIAANGWRFMRNPGAKYLYEVPAGKAALAAAEAFAYGADAVLKIDPADVRAAGEMLKFLASLPPIDLPAAADFAVVDDGSALTGEVMNLLVRRNLLFEVVRAPVQRFGINIRIGAPEYPRSEAADPSAFALMVRRRLTDEQRSLRVYGSEVVIARLTTDAGRARLHLINYGGRDVEGLRVRVRGVYRGGEAFASGAGRFALGEQSVGGGATEFSIPRLTTYAVVDLR